MIENSLKNLVLGLILFSLFSINSYAEVPPHLNLCKFEDYDCIISVTNNIISNGANGIKDLQIPPLEPLKIKVIDIGKTKDSAVSFDLKLKDLDIYGTSKVKMNRIVGFSKDPKTSKFELYAKVPKFNFKGQYKISGKILVLPISGEGPCNITLEAVKISIKYKPKIVSVKNGKHYISVEKLKVLLEPENMKLHFNNLFNGNEELGKNMNQFINENWREIWADVGPSVNTEVSEILKTLISDFLKLAPYEDFFQKN